MARDKIYVADKETLDKVYNILATEPVWGFIEHMSIKSPSQRIEAIGLNKTYRNVTRDGSTGIVSMNDWANFPVVKANKPYMVKSDGTPDYMLSETNYALKADGVTASDVSNVDYDGGAFSWMPRVYKHERMEGNDRVVMFSMTERDGFGPVGFVDGENNVLEGVWLPMFYGSILGADGSTPKMVSLAGLQPHHTKTTAEQNTAINNFSSRARFLGGPIVETIIDILIMMAGTTDLQTAYGKGNCKGYDGLYKVLNQRIDNIAEDILKNEYARNRIQAVSNAISNLLRWLPNVVCFVFALMEVFSGNLSVGELLAFEVLFAKITDPISELPFRINDAREMLVSLNRIDDILNAPKESGGVQILNADYSGKNVIVLENASYWYDTNPDRRILDGLNLVFEKGKTTAIVGSSGAGKSTLFKLLCGFETLREGKYLFMGQDFSKLDIGAAREKIAIVTQNVFLFPDTVAENVAYGKSVASIKEIEEACREACIHDYIKSLPDGYETMVGERGANMSGGEKQRLSIARAILKDAPIILMDEPTSALDTGTETAVTNALDELRKVKEDKTIIIIAHRLSTIINADRIVVMEHGKIVETGTHRELLERGGVYAGLYARECSADY